MTKRCRIEWVNSRWYFSLFFACESPHSALCARAGPWRWTGAAWVRGRAVAGLRAEILFGGAVAVVVATARSARVGSWTAWSEYVNRFDTPYRTPCAQREREQITALRCGTYHKFGHHISASRSEFTSGKQTAYNSVAAAGNFDLHNHDTVSYGIIPNPNEIIYMIVSKSFEPVSILLN